MNRGTVFSGVLEFSKGSVELLAVAFVASPPSAHTVGRQCVVYQWDLVCREEGKLS